MQLQKFFPQWNLYDPSPFCMKAAILLQMAGQSFEASPQMHPGDTPRQKLPVLIDDDKTIPDTTFIRKYLEQKSGHDFDAGLSQNERAQAYFLARTADEYAYWLNVRMRWGTDENWSTFSNALFGKVPKPMRRIVAEKSRKTAKANLQGQGIGRFPTEEFAILAADLISALEIQLQDTKFAMADEPTSADASLYPFLISAAVPPIKSPVKDLVLESERLKTYCNQMSEKFFPDHQML